MSIMYPYPGIFNVLDPWWDSTGHGDYIGMKPGNVAPNPANNYHVLLEIIQLAQASNDQTPGLYYGATIIFPGHNMPATQGGTGEDQSGVYFIQGPGDGTTTVQIESNWPIKFMGTGSAKLVNYIDPDNPGFVIGDFFSILTDGQYDSNIHHTFGENLGGMTFENLTLQFDKNTTQTGVAGIHTITNPNGGKGGAQNVRINGCVFTDCPIAVWFEEALQCSMFQCTVNLTDLTGTGLKIGGPDRTVDAVVIHPSAKDIFITDCIFEVSPDERIGGNVGLDLISAEHVRLKSVRFDGFDKGIQIRPGYNGVGSPSGLNVVRCFFTDVTVFVGLDEPSGGEAGTALTIRPQGTGQQVGQLTFVGCTFEPGSDTTITSTAGAGITIDANGSIIDTVRFVSCYSCRWAGPGLSIGVSGGTGTLQNIEVLGGMYAGNNFKPSAPVLPYGIAVFEPASAVRISGVSCVGQYEFIQHSASPSPSKQQVGAIYIEGAVNEVIIDGCDLRDGTTYGVYINGTSGHVPTNVFIRNCDISDISPYSNAVFVTSNANVSNIQVTNCAGYNDQAAPLSLTFSFGTGTFHSYTTGYWGPIQFLAVPGALETITSVKLSSLSTNATSGAFILVPGSETATITWTPTTLLLTIHAIGQ